MCITSSNGYYIVRTYVLIKVFGPKYLMNRSTKSLFGLRIPRKN